MWRVDVFQTKTGLRVYAGEHQLPTIEFVGLLAHLIAAYGDKLSMIATRLAR